MLPYSFIGTGTYTSNGTSQTVPLTDQPDWFFVKDTTNWGAQSTAAAAIYSEWFSSFASGDYLGIGQPNSTGSGVTLYSTQGTSGGFTFINPASPPSFSQITGTTINDSTFVASTSNTAGLNVGDIVRITNSTGMLQIGGYTFAVTAVSSNTSFTLGYMASAVSAGLTIAANASAFKWQKMIPSVFYPRRREIAFITQATQAVVYFTRPNDFTVGELVDFNIPSEYGMLSNGSPGLNFLTGQPGGAAQVVAVTNSSTVSSITINVNTTGFTAFTLPTSATYSTPGNPSPATCFPAGSGVVPNQSPPGTNLLDAFDNRNQFYMQLGANVVGANGAAMQWFAFKADFNNAITNA